MSFRSIQQNTVEKTDTFSLNSQQLGTVTGAPVINQYPDGRWFRNPTWPALPSITASDEKIVGLYAVYPNGSNFLSFNIQTSAGLFTVDWGDGNVISYTSNTNVNKNYNFNDAALADTNGPVTFTDSGDTVNRNNHGYQNDMPISFDSITTTTGINANQIYYVVNATTNTFQLSDTPGGTPLALTNDGSGIILPYKIAIVQIYPAVSGGPTLTSVNLQVRNTSTTQQYVGMWLDIAISVAATTLTIGATSPTIWFNFLEQIRILRHRLTTYSSFLRNLYGLQNIVEITAASGVNQTSANDMFRSCVLLKTIPSFNVSSVSTATSMFYACRSLEEIPILNFTGALTATDQMFAFCSRLLKIPLFNTVAVTDMSGMFSNCISLQTIPSLRTSSVSLMPSIFNECRSLQSIPLLDTNNVTNMDSMFYNCYSLSTVPLLNTNKVTSMNNMFFGCSSLQAIPLLNTGNVSFMSNMFDSCTSLKTIPLLNTIKVSFMTNMFQNCFSLQSIPLLNTSNVTTMNGMFRSCGSLQTVPLFNTANVTDMGSMFSLCGTLINVPAFNTTKVANVVSMFASCQNLVSLPAFNLSNVSSSANFNSFFGGPSLKRIQITNVYYSWFLNNNNLSGTELNEVYTNLPNVWPATTAVTFDGTADTVTLTGHGYANLRTVSFATITTTTGISTNTNYFVRNATTDTFQLSTTATGSIINLVNNGNGTLNGQTITVTGNWGTATDTPSIATAKGWTVTGS